MKILESNKLIAEFMGIKTITQEELEKQLRENRKNGFIHTPNAYTLEELKHHNSWDWLMPVINSIYNMDIDEQENNIIGDITHSLVDINILSTYENVVEFIKWYNENK